MYIFHCARTKPIDCTKLSFQAVSRPGVTKILAFYPMYVGLTSRMHGVVRQDHILNNFGGKAYEIA